MSQLKTGIGADTNLYTPSDIGRVHKTLAVFNRFVTHNPACAPWLDVGSGESYMLERLTKDYGTEITTTEIDLDVTPYPYPDNHFKTITSFELIEHLFNPLFHLFEIKRVLAPDGNLYLTTPNDLSLIYKVEHALSRKYRPHFHQFSALDLEDLCKRAGLKIVAIEKFYRSKSGTIARLSRNGLFLHAKKETDRNSTS